MEGVQLPWEQGIAVVGCVVLAFAIGVAVRAVWRDVMIPGRDKIFTHVDKLHNYMDESNETSRQQSEQSRQQTVALENINRHQTAINERLGQLVKLSDGDIQALHELRQRLDKKT